MGKADMLMALTLALQRVWAACRAESRPSGDVTPTSRARRRSVCDRHTSALRIALAADSATHSMSIIKGKNPYRRPLALPAWP